MENPTRKPLITLLTLTLTLIALNTYNPHASSALLGEEYRTGWSFPNLSIEDPITKPQFIEPGDTVELWVRIVNTGHSRASKVEAHIEHEKSEDSKNIIFMRSRSSLGVIDQGGYGIAYFRLKISPDAPSSIYKIRVVATCENMFKEKSEFSQNIEIPVRGTARFSISLLDRKPLTPGESRTLRFKITNTGTGTAQYLELKFGGDRSTTSPGASLTLTQQSVATSIPTKPTSQATPSMYPTATSTGSLPLSAPTPSYPPTPTVAPRGLTTLPMPTQTYITTLGAPAVYLGSLRPGESAVAYFRVHVDRNTPSGAFSVPLTIKYEEEVEQVWGPLSVTEIENNLTYRRDTTTYKQIVKEVSFTDYIGLLVVGKPDINIANVLTSPTTIRPGDNLVEITMMVENSGEGEARNVETYLLLEYPFEASQTRSDRAYVGLLKPGESRNIVFKVDVDEKAEKKTYTIPLVVTYKEEDGSAKEFRTGIELSLRGRPDFKIVKSWSEPLKLVQGQEDAKLYVTIKNIGSEQAESVELRVLRRSGQPFDFSKRSDFVGTLDPGEEATAILEFDVDKNAGVKTHILNISIRAVGDREEGDDNVYTYEDKIRLTIEKAPSRLEKLSTQSTAKMVVPLILLVVIVVILLVKIGSKRRGTT
ncbi:MAG: hypothetical protein DRO11_00470 [Methanobacteriota archaeon]|nr:MAG: hypothetical protein DRO11_00470 [Euryarchaeota archaeon]